MHPIILGIWHDLLTPTSDYLTRDWGNLSKLGNLLVRIRSRCALTQVTHSNLYPAGPTQSPSERFLSAPGT